MNDINGQVWQSGTKPNHYCSVSYTATRISNSTVRYVFTISDWLGNSSSYIGNGYGLDAKITINGWLYGITTIKYPTDYWKGTDKHYTTITLDAPISSNTILPVTFETYSTGTTQLYSGVTYQSGYEVIGKENCIPPIFYVTPTLSYITGYTQNCNFNYDTVGNPGIAGDNNTISRFLIEYRIKSTIDGTWGDWAQLSYVNYLEGNFTQNISTGYYIQFAFTVIGSNYNSYRSICDSIYRYYPYGTNTVPSNIIIVDSTTGLSDKFSSSVSISFNAGTAGTNGGISGYQIQYYISSNGATWSSPITLSTVSSSGTFSYILSGVTNTQYVKFRIRTLSSISSSFNSSYVYSSIIKKVSTKCSSPILIVTPIPFVNTLSFNWSGAVSYITNGIKGYTIQYRIRSTNGTYTDTWQTLFTPITSNTYGEYNNYNLSSIVENLYYIQFRVKTNATDSDYDSDWTIIQEVQRLAYGKLKTPSYLKVNEDDIMLGYKYVSTDGSTANNSRVYLEWGASENNTLGTGNTLIGYVWQYSTSENFDTVNTYTLYSGTGNLNTYVNLTTGSVGFVTFLGSLEYGSKIYFRVQADGSAGTAYNSDWYTDENCYVIKSTPPLKPTNLQLSLSTYDVNDSLILLWTNNYNEQDQAAKDLFGDNGRIQTRVSYEYANTPEEAAAVTLFRVMSEGGIDTTSNEYFRIKEISSISYDSTKVYQKDDCCATYVDYLASYYKCLVNNTSNIAPTNTSNWMVITESEFFNYANIDGFIGSTDEQYLVFKIYSLNYATEHPTYDGVLKSEDVKTMNVIHRSDDTGLKICVDNKWTKVGAINNCSTLWSEDIHIFYNNNGSWEELTTYLN